MERLFSSSISYPNDNELSDMVAIDGGRFYTGPHNKGILVEYLARKQQQEDYQMALVPLADDKTIFFADIDDTPDNFNLDLFLETIAESFNALATNKIKDTTSDDLLVLQRENAQKYHIYIPAEFGETSKKERQAIYKKVNTFYENDIIDLAAHTIRFEGFQKFDTKTGEFVSGSRYLPIRQAAAYSCQELLLKVWINPRGWASSDPSSSLVENSIAARLALAAAIDNEEKEANEALEANEAQEANEPQVDNQDNEEKEELEPRALKHTVLKPLRRPVERARATSVDVMNKSIAADIEDKVKSHCPEIAHIVLSYPIKTFRKKAGFITMILDKSEKGRTCQIAGAVHSKNNIYLVYNQKMQALYQKCFSSNCVKQRALIYKIKVEKKKLQSRDLPTSDDASLAEWYERFRPLTRVEKDGKNINWYVFDSTVGYWRKETTETIMKSIMIDFRVWIKVKFDKLIESGEADDDDIVTTAKDIDRKLNSSRDLNGIAQCIKWRLSSSKRIEWNSKADYTVFPNGVLQLDKRDPKYPQLYYFGPTRPDEYINDARIMRAPFNVPPVCNDGHYITQANELLKDWIMLIQPMAEDRKLLLTFLALSLKAINYKKMILNIGHAGDNAKSSFFEFVVHCFSDYGVTGDKALIVKGKKDRVSKAVLNEKRFVLFEEPDPSKPLDVEFIKDLVGGAVKTAGRMNFSNDNEITLHCKTVLNANTMTSVQLESAILNRLLFLAWYTIFTNDARLVNHANRIYLADEKFKTPGYWDSVFDGLIWLLLNHFRIYENNGFKLAVSDRQIKRTKAQLMENDLFIRWFSSNYVFLTSTEANKKKFISVEEVTAEFQKLTPTQQNQIIGRRNYQPAKYVKDMLQTHSALKQLYVTKMTNWRLSKAERRARGAKNKIGLNCQYISHVLIRFVTRGEFEASNLEKADLAADDPACENDNDGANEDNGEAKEDNEDVEEDDGGESVIREAIGTVKDNYLYSDDLFYFFKEDAHDDVIIEADDHGQEGILNDENEYEMVDYSAIDQMVEIEQQFKAASVDVGEDNDAIAIAKDDDIVMIDIAASKNGAGVDPTDNNDNAIDVDANSNDDNGAGVDASGNDVNEAGVDANGNDDNEAVVEANGNDDNEAGVEANGNNDNEAVVEANGNDNEAGVDANGNDNGAGVDANGNDDNEAGVDANGNGGNDHEQADVDGNKKATGKKRKMQETSIRNSFKKKYTSKRRRRR